MMLINLLHRPSPKSTRVQFVRNRHCNLFSMHTAVKHSYLCEQVTVCWDHDRCAGHSWRGNEPTIRRRKGKALAILFLQILFAINPTVSLSSQTHGPVSSEASFPNRWPRRGTCLRRWSYHLISSGFGVLYAQQRCTASSLGCSAWQASLNKKCRFTFDLSHNTSTLGVWQNCHQQTQGVGPEGEGGGKGGQIAENRIAKVPSS